MSAGLSWCWSRARAERELQAHTVLRWSYEACGGLRACLIEECPAAPWRRVPACRGAAACRGGAAVCRGVWAAWCGNIHAVGVQLPLSGRLYARTCICVYAYHERDGPVCPSDLVVEQVYWSHTFDTVSDWGKPYYTPNIT